ncbi:DUF2264 domain-containing protein [Duganella sp. BJB488]|uniref:DUF2264 domain-containing protein n=1 Tax=unclassified Duganella TaxID=2636909 RepID=UPI000E34917D|nr:MULTISPECIES: DUF2264 domain-containing protein [unclassified Duganella]RFP14020.1 DUF2264 domain-containing protein [Duganella sp. BJB489]RFP17396.1 DUF2264 domain-containing protein [Duganella sp. BJB488]RFP31814.1 DUF2264 domain-containing protein [Duganella sp. BJB480]
MERRNFMQAVLAGTAATGLMHAGAAAAADSAPVAGGERAYMAGLLQQMAEPVLSNMAQGKLKKNFPLELSPTWDGRDPGVAYLECFGRLIAGAAPWLALPDDGTAEGKTRHRLQQLALQSYTNSVDPKNPDYLLWKGPGQTLVDSAYFTNALMRAPKALWEPLDRITKQRIIAEIKSLRRIEPPYINWLLFAAMNEAWLLSIGEEADPLRMNLAIRKINEWYVGDGWIKDGESFHFDYYCSYVMYPMLLEILEVLVRCKGAFWNAKPEELLAQALQRTQRYCEHLERFISPTGTYPPIGRSLTYRTAVFQPLGLLAWRKQLPASLPAGQVRAALHAVHQTVWSGPSNFTRDGFLNIGFVGHHPELGDWYSNNGSMYIASEGFLSLGLPENDAYWTAPAQDWTQKLAYSGRQFPKDYPVKY